MKEDQTVCQNPEEDQAIWRSLITSILSLIMTALLVLQKMTKRVNTKVCPASVCDVTKIIQQLSILSQDSKCCTCNQNDVSNAGQYNLVYDVDVEEGQTYDEMNLPMSVVTPTEELQTTDVISENNGIHI